MVISKSISDTAKKLKSAGIENAMHEAGIIVRSVLGIEPIDIILSGDDNIKSTDMEKISNIIRRRASREPLAYILGSMEFMGLDFAVNENVLIPRQDTEILVDAVLSENRGMNILDICTGSGCVGLSILHFNKNSYLLGTDISSGAINVANENAKRLSLSDRARFVKSDIMEEIPSGVFDAVVSNPP